MQALSFLVVFMCFIRALTLFTGTRRRRVLFSNFGKKTFIVNLKCLLIRVNKTTASSEFSDNDSSMLNCLWAFVLDFTKTKQLQI